MKYIVTAILLAVSGPVFAQSAEVSRACDAIDMLAPLIMEQRQSGAAMDELLPYANLAQGTVRQLAENMIRDAYGVSIAQDAGGKAAAAEQFKQKWVADCYASFQ